MQIYVLMSLIQRINLPPLLFKFMRIFILLGMDKSKQELL